MSKRSTLYRFIFFIIYYQDLKKEEKDANDFVKGRRTTAITKTSG